MARSQKFDYLHNMRFHVAADAGNPDVVKWLTDPGSVGDQTEAGFSAVTLPEATLEAVEYREGQYLYTRKYPGHVTFSDITLSRGVALMSTGFWNWMHTAIIGTGEYRTDLAIKHYHRADTLPGWNADNAASSGNVTGVNLSIGATTSVRVYTVHQAIPVRHKLGSDLDATDSAVSVMELDVAYEYLSVDANAAK